ncbi:MAG: hypothetical protein AAFX87_13000 [Bacteroidota bacterium]
MKLLKRVLIVLVMGFTTTSNAQDASNNATWEETIDFLEEFLPNFNNTIDAHTYIFNFDGTTLDKKRKYQFNDGKKCTDNWKGDINYIKSVSVNSNFIRIQFTGNLVSMQTQCENVDAGIATYQDIFLVNLLEKKDLNQRLLKALKHLAYLAKEKRKKSKF